MVDRMTFVELLQKRDEYVVSLEGILRFGTDAQRLEACEFMVAAGIGCQLGFA